MLKNPLILGAAGITFIVYAVGLVYSVLALLGDVPLTQALYLICLFSLAACSTFLFSLIWRERKRGMLSLGSQVGIVLAWGMVVWYWFFSPVYYLLIMNLNDLQLRWGFFYFIWIISIIAWMFIFISLRIFRPIEMVMDDKTTPEIRLYERLANFPLTISVLHFIFTAFSFFVGTLELMYFADTSIIDLWKNFADGLIISVFLGVIYYVVFQNLLGDVRAAIQTRIQDAIPIRGSIIRRMLVIFTLVVFSSLCLLQLVLVRSLQDLISNSLTNNRLQRDIGDKKWEQRLLDVGGKTFFLGQDPHFDHETFGPETAGFIYSRNSGVIFDSNVEPKLVAFFIDPATGQKSIIVLFLYSFYGALEAGILFFAGASLFVLLISIGIVAIVTYTLTESLYRLTRSIEFLGKDKNAEVARVSSGDEIERLSTTLSYFVHQSRESDRAKDEFIAIASHQLRTPLTQLEWTVDALEKGDLSADIKEYFPDIKTSVIHLSGLVNILLNAHRLEENKTKLNAARFDLLDFVRACIKKDRPLATHKGVIVELKCDDEKIEAFSDKAIFETIVDSIISNAIEYTPRGGSVAVSVKKQGDRVLLTFTDTGIGIPYETQSKIFQKFVRAHNAMLVKTAGTGLGLYVAKQCILILGGTIRFDSEPDKGTTFYVDLPLHITAVSGPESGDQEEKI